MARKSRIMEGSYDAPIVEGYEWRMRLERAYMDRMVDRLMVEGCMRHDPSNNRRGTVDHAASSVRATEVRYSERPRVRGNVQSNESMRETLDDARYSSRAPKRFRDRFDTSVVSYRGIAAICLSAGIDADTVKGAFPSLVSAFDAPTRERVQRAPKTAATIDHAGTYAARVALLGVDTSLAESVS